MAQTSPEDSNHWKTPKSANLSWVVWVEPFTIHQYPAGSAGSSIPLGRLFLTAEQQAGTADGYLWLKVQKILLKACKSEEPGQIPASLIPSPNIPAAVSIGKPSCRVLPQAWLLFPWNNLEVALG